jgi:ATP-binding cassette, subfamily C (CFTR/MRP), member 1
MAEHLWEKMMKQYLFVKSIPGFENLFLLHCIADILLHVSVFILCDLHILILLMQSLLACPFPMASLNSLVYYTILISCMIENDMAAVERVNQYSTLPSEAAWKVADRLPSPNWPSLGNIDIRDLKVNNSFYHILVI